MIGAGPKSSGKNTRNAQRSKRRRITKQSEADARDQSWRSLSSDQQVKALDSRLGVGVGATRQRGRIASNAGAV